MAETTKEDLLAEIQAKEKEHKLIMEIEKYENELPKCADMIVQKELDAVDNQKNIKELQNQQKTIDQDIKFYTEKKSAWQEKIKELKEELKNGS